MTCSRSRSEKAWASCYIGEDLDVLLELCDRILVLCGGKVNGHRARPGFATKELLGLKMTGALSARGSIVRMTMSEKTATPFVHVGGQRAAIAPGTLVAIAPGWPSCWPWSPAASSCCVLNQNPPGDLSPTMVTGRGGQHHLPYGKPSKIAIPLCVIRAGHYPGLQNALLEHRRRGANLPGGHRGQLFCAYVFAARLAQPVLLMTGDAGGRCHPGRAACGASSRPVFKARFGTNETLFDPDDELCGAATSSSSCGRGPGSDPAAMGFPNMPRFEKAARMPTVLGVHAGLGHCPGAGGAGISLSSVSPSRAMS